MTQATVLATPPLVRRLVFTADELALLGEVLPGNLPTVMVPATDPASASNDGSRASAAPDRDGLLAGLVERGVLAPRADGGSLVDGAGKGFDVVAPVAHTWRLLTTAPTAIDLTLAGQAPAGSATPVVGQRAWVSLLGDAAASLRRVDETRVEMSVFLADRLSAELDELIPDPGAFAAARRRESIADALGGTAARRPRPATAGDGFDRVPGDDPEARAITGQARVSLRATVMTTTPRGPAAGTHVWICTEDSWWQVDQDWARWQRTGARETVLTRVQAGQAGAALTQQVQRLLRAGASLTAPETPAGVVPGE